MKIDIESIYDKRNFKSIIVDNNICNKRIQKKIVFISKIVYRKKKLYNFFFAYCNVENNFIFCRMYFYRNKIVFLY